VKSWALAAWGSRPIRVLKSTQTASIFVTNWALPNSVELGLGVGLGVLDADIEADDEVDMDADDEVAPVACAGAVVSLDELPHADRLIAASTATGRQSWRRAVFITMTPESGTGYTRQQMLTKHKAIGARRGHRITRSTSCVLS
jgi:hypothetical protein